MRSPVTHTAALKRVITARTALALDEPFFGPLALRLELQEDVACPTAWVDGKTLGYNPQFVMSLSPAELGGLLVHEVMHCAAGHPWRRDVRDPRKWNEACDRVINPIITDAGFKLPDGALVALEPSHLGKSAEWVYDRLPAPQTPQQGGRGRSGSSGSAGPQGAPQPSGGSGQQGPGNEAKTTQDSGPAPRGGSHAQAPTSPSTGQPRANESVCPKDTQSEGSAADHKSSPLGEVRDAPSDIIDVDGGGEVTEEQWKQAVQQAAAIARGQGKLPGSLQRYAKDAARQQVDWRSALRRFAQEVARADYSFARPNSRYAASGFIMPALRNHEVGVIAVAIDTSGSIDSVLLDQFTTELRAIHEEVRPRQVRVLYADAKVQREDVFERDDTIELHPCGGGGTDFRPVFRAVLEWEEPPVAVVYLTDLAGRFPEEEPPIPTLWVTGDEPRREVPFGEVVTTT